MIRPCIALSNSLHASSMELHIKGQLEKRKQRCTVWMMPQGHWMQLPGFCITDITSMSVKVLRNSRQCWTLVRLWIGMWLCSTTIWQRPERTFEIGQALSGPLFMSCSEKTCIVHNLGKQVPAWVPCKAYNKIPAKPTAFFLQAYSNALQILRQSPAFSTDQCA